MWARLFLSLALCLVAPSLLGATATTTSGDRFSKIVPVHRNPGKAEPRSYWVKTWNEDCDTNGELWFIRSVNFESPEHVGCNQDERDPYDEGVLDSTYSQVCFDFKDNSSHKMLLQWSLQFTMISELTLNQAEFTLAQCTDTGVLCPDSGLVTNTTGWLTDCCLIDLEANIYGADVITIQDNDCIALKVKKASATALIAQTRSVWMHFRELYP